MEACSRSPCGASPHKDVGRKGRASKLEAALLLPLLLLYYYRPLLFFLNNKLLPRLIGIIAVENILESLRDKTHEIGVIASDFGIHDAFRGMRCISTTLFPSFIVSKGVSGGYLTAMYSNYTYR